MTGLVSRLTDLDSGETVHGHILVARECEELQT